MESMADKKRASQNLYKRIDRLDRISRSPQRDRTPQQDYSFKYALPLAIFLTFT